MANLLGSRMQILVMYGSPFSLTDEETGEIREGLTIEYYMFGDNGEQLQPAANASAGAALGIRRAKCSMDVSMKDKLMYVPGVYDAEFQMNVGADGKMNLKAVSLEYVGRPVFGLNPDDVPQDAGADPVPDTKDAPEAAGTDPVPDTKNSPEAAGKKK